MVMKGVFNEVYPLFVFAAIIHSIYTKVIVNRKYSHKYYNKTPAFITPDKGLCKVYFRKYIC